MRRVSEQPNIERKRSLFRDLTQLVNTRIGREAQSIEREAIAFAVERSFQEPITPEVFLRVVLGVDDGDSPRDASMKIHTSIYELKMQKIGEMISSNPSDAERLTALRENIQIGHNMTMDNYSKPNAPIFIGAVSQDWVPQWVGQPQAANASGV